MALATPYSNYYASLFGGPKLNLDPTVNTASPAPQPTVQPKAPVATTAANLSSAGTTTGGIGSSDYFSKIMNLLQPTSPQDYLSEARTALQPSIEAQVAPLKETQTLIPQLFEAAKTQIGQQQMAELGTKRAGAAAQGITSTSGVEISAEANITQNYAAKLSMLPLQESQALLDVAGKIATIYGQGETAALTYASELAKMVSDEAYKQADVALKMGDQDMANQQLDEAIRHNQATEYLSSLTAGKVTPTVTSGVVSGFTTPQGAYYPSQQPNILDRLKSAIFGQPTQTNEVFAKNPQGEYVYIPRGEAADAQSQGYTVYQ